MKKDRDLHYLPINKALIWILSSIIVISGSSFLAFLYYRQNLKILRHDPKYQIVALVQTFQDKESLKTVYLAELLGLSIDQTMNIYEFDAKFAREKLLSSPVIKDAAITKIKPGTIWVDYSLRKPIAFLRDYANTMIDAEGTVFPFKPFFTPKMLPDVNLGIADEEASEEDIGGQKLYWGKVLQGKRVDLAFILLDLVKVTCCNDGIRLTLIDVSKAFALSYGERQIIVILEDRFENDVQGIPMLSVRPLILRLGTENYREQLKHFMALHARLKQKNNANTSNVNEQTGRTMTTILDLRLSDLAFICNET